MSNDRRVHDHGTEEGHDAHEGLQHGTKLSHRARRLLAMKELLVEKGVITEDEVRDALASMDSRSPAQGASVVARAWADGDFRGRLLREPEAAVAELGYTFPSATKLVVVENTREVHHLVVCTLCSCYPTALLGPPPDWYKSLAYRSRAVVDPRGVLREFGVDVDGNVEVRVLDSTADVRYLVLPRRPAGSEGLTEGELAGLVTRDSMIGVSEPRSL